MLRQIAFLLLAILTLGSNSRAETPRFDMTWDQVFEARVALIKIQRSFVAHSRLRLERSGSEGGILPYDKRNELIAFANNAVVSLQPFGEKLDSYKNRFRTNDVDSFAKYIVLQSAYFASATVIIGTINDAAYFGDAIRINKNDPRVTAYLKINADIMKQIENQSERKSISSEDRSLSMIKSPTIRTLIENGKVISSAIRRGFDLNLRQTIFEALNEDLEAFVASQDAFQKRYLSYIKLQTPIFYGIQAAVLSATSDIYLPRDHYITDQMIDDLTPSFEPGDIALIRHKYKLTNIGINGAWAHSLIILGTPDKLFKFFNSDEETKQTFAALCAQQKLPCSNFSGYLETKYRDIYLQYVGGGLYKNKPIQFAALESKKDGVIFSNIYEAIRKDQLAVIRPNLSKKDRALAVASAFSFYGRKYDYSFDLRSDERLICTELIAYSYEPIASMNKSGIDFKFSHHGKTPLVYPEDIVKTFGDGLNQSNPLLKFVVYLRETAAGKTMEHGDAESLARTAQ
ncbi:MAG TPA: YiiX/YebB-like N1pC/P60 family cysteine hydrolase [Bdellovibrionales bacterium]|nr:YiiX/YebB-like N1pC/P60 family cysteine hydrolase [Bdellovibrionales bacterium]